MALADPPSGSDLGVSNARDPVSSRSGAVGGDTFRRQYSRVPSRAEERDGERRKGESWGHPGQGGRGTGEYATGMRGADPAPAPQQAGKRSL